MKFSFAPGATPLPGYTIKRAIHRGGFGEVYQAESDAGKEVALKLIHKNQDTELRGVRQCLNLKHANLVSIFDVRQDADGDPWVIMEYVPGRTLATTLETSPQGLSLDEVHRWLTGIATGLDYLHGQGLVHRDLKPANLFQETDGTIKIGDVGLSKFITDSRRDGQTGSVGTVYYMAPEIAKGEYGREIDVYALGVILYEMLTGEIPFEGETTAEILMKHLTESPDLSKLPVKLRSVLSRALRKDPQQRTPSAKMLLLEFEKATGRGSHSTTASTRPPRGTSVPVRTGTTRNRRPSYRGPVPVRVASGMQGGSGVRTLTVTGLEMARQITAFVIWSSLFILFVIFWAVGLLDDAFLPVAVIATPVLWMLRRNSLPMRTLNGWISGPEPTPEPRRPTPRTDDQTVLRDSPRMTIKPGLRRVHWRCRPGELSPETRREMPMRDRLVSLGGSMLIATVGVAVLTGVVTWLSAWQNDFSTVLHFGTVALLGSWGLLAVGKLTEGTAYSSGQRRLLQMFAGVMVGAVAFGLQQWLLVPTDHLSIGSDSFRGGMTHLGRQQLLLGNGQPSLTGYIVFFGALFMARRWWRQSDSLRKARFKVSSVLLTSAVGITIVSFLAFPAIYGLLWAVTLGTMVQMTSGWLEVDERIRLVEASR